MTRKTTSAALLLALIASAGCNSNELKDKLYLDDHWNVIQNVDQASFYRLYNASDKSEGPKPFRDYYMSGALQSEGCYLTMDKNKNMEIKVDGLVTFYTENGVKYIESNYKNGLMHGKSTNYDPETGKLSYIEEYKNDTLLRSTTYDESGKITSESIRDADNLFNARIYNYDEKGDTLYKQFGKIDENNLRQGYWEALQLDGKEWVVIMKYNFKDDKMEGPAMRRELSRNTENTGNYSDDKKVGVWTYKFLNDGFKQITNHDNSKEPTRFYTFDDKPFTGKHSETRDLDEAENPDEADDTINITIKNSYIQEVTYTNSKTGKVIRTVKYKNGLPVEQ